MKTKRIEMVVSPRSPHYVGDGFRVQTFIPISNRLDMKRMDPFILMDYNSPHYFPPSDRPRGVGVHPHRGFETVTIAYQGSVAHHDSSGGGGIIKEGDVQWMTAGSGVLHKEYHETNFSKAGGYFQMVQLWVNLPAKDKMTTPKYQSLVHENIPVVTLDDEGGVIEVIAGEYNGVAGAASTFSPVNLMNAKLNTGGKGRFSFPSHYNTAVVVVSGSVLINGDEVVNSDHFVLFENQGEDFTVEAKEESIVLVLSGEPFNEPIAAQGPFVMNTREQLMEAMQDYNLGRFGYLED
ncbi:pirin family protein [Membranihabitans marinus]|uniref:pirin family protein n=1 Tax=Membranihabitans marinus TaxID=1227546 RepID=UPI001F203B01|nr:pirin family protein [Membranihabitans marinus]